MNPLFRYLFNCNRKKIAVLYFGFITISLLLLFNMMGLSKVTSQLTKDITLGIYVLIIGMTAFLLLLIALPSFNKMLKNTMIRYTAISGKKYIYANLFFFTLMFIFLLVIGLIFLYYFSQNTYGGKVIGGYQQEFHELFAYGLLHHILSVLLWGIDFMSILISCYFIMVITKLIPIKSSKSKIALSVGFLAVFLTIQTFVLDILSKLEKYVITIKSTGFIDKNGFIDTSLYPSEGFTILDICFTCLFIIVLTVITGRIIDKKLEI
ncbi:ABC transporter permease [Bacillus thuringiensis]|uniref:ABC transporter permease n=1 Tax=Bacillus thuringiensis TaxID=1428 RepID=A0ABD6RX44_BACTU|nr:ABC transporter permease [Bacillus thuringiensis]HDR8065851.1 ABC transporter permease [Bacillus cereus]PER40353.1 ABC transporter permease [Bacillus thuringiensis]PEU85875.1 ABC transporter permease [Bacillus thuringiensis]PEY84980.1 ABC transporter permease [Bacillus thuringiensis]PFI05234.1 ABC transporter permease [Bacillus thuringiensis]